MISRFGIDYIEKEFKLGQHPRGWSAGFLSYDENYNDSLPAIWDALSRTTEIPIFKIHLRYDKEGAYSYHEIKDEAYRTSLLTNQFADQPFEISPALNHKFSEREFYLLIEVLRPLFGENVSFLNCPDLKSGGELSFTYKNQVLHKDEPAHGFYNVSVPFGVDLGEAVARHRNAAKIYLWGSLNEDFNDLVAQF